MREKKKLAEYSRQFAVAMTKRMAGLGLVNGCLRKKRMVHRNACQKCQCERRTMSLEALSRIEAALHIEIIKGWYESV